MAVNPKLELLRKKFAKTFNDDLEIAEALLEDEPAPEIIQRAIERLGTSVTKGLEELLPDLTPAQRAAKRERRRFDKAFEVSETVTKSTDDGTLFPTDMSSPAHAVRAVEKAASALPRSRRR